MQQPLHLIKGRQIEDLAANFIQSKGLVIVQRNFSCKMGEIDLILNDHGILVFAEVRYRQSNEFGGALESVTLAKQKRIIRAAQFYLKQFKIVPTCRFDVIVVEGNEPPEWIQNAWA